MTRRVEVAVGLLQREGRCFLQRREANARIFPGLWELPGGKLEAGESPEQALRRELMEELDWVASELRFEVSLDQPYGSTLVRIHAFRCEGEAHPRPGLSWGWFTREEALALPLPEATRRLLMDFA